MTTETREQSPPTGVRNDKSERVVKVGRGKVRCPLQPSIQTSQRATFSRASLWYSIHFDLPLISSIRVTSKPYARSAPIGPLQDRDAAHPRRFQERRAHFSPRRHQW